MRVPKATKAAWAIVRPKRKSLGLYETTHKWLLYENSMQHPRQPERKLRPECKAKILKRPKWTTDIHVIEPSEAWILLYPCIVTTQRGKVVEAYEYNDVV